MANNKRLTGKWLAELGVAWEAAPEVAIPNSGVPEPVSPEQEIPNTGTVSSGIPELVGQNIVGRQTRIIEARDVQTGHSHGEQLVYTAMWSAGAGYSGGGQNKVITAGYRVIGSLIKGGMTVNNVKANIESLIQKRALERVGEGKPIQGATYIVYSFGAVLERRRAVGLTHIVRKTRRVEFVNPDTGVAVLGIPEFNTGTANTGMRKGNPGIPNAGMLLKERQIEERREEARRVLSDPNAGPNEQLAARSVLGEE
jgi:hypothetical protein